MKSRVRSFILIVIDRFFDTIILTIVLIPYVIGYTNSIISLLSIILVISILLLFLVFNKSYKYLNNFLIVNSKTKRGVIALKYLDALKIYYDYIFEIIDGKKTLLLFTSILAWSFEFIAFRFFCQYINMKFTYTNFITNINSSFTSVQKNDYIVYSLVFFLITYLIFLAKESYEKINSSSRR